MSPVKIIINCIFCRSDHDVVHMYNSPPLFKYSGEFLTASQIKSEPVVSAVGTPSGNQPVISATLLSTPDTSQQMISYLSVTFHMTETDVNIALKGIDAIETREKLLGIETLLSGDKYSFVKDAYIQSMYYEIKDGIDVEDEFIDDMDDFLIDE